MQKKYCVIFGAGKEYPEEISVPDNSVVIAADGGLSALIKFGISPDFIIGDFDSLGSIPRGENVTVLPCEKDFTDTAEAVKIGYAQGCTDFMIYGGTGGRLDHTLANIQLASDIAAKNCGVKMYGDCYIIAVICGGSITLSGNCGDYVSVFSLSDVSENVTISGLKYEVNNVCLKNSFALGVSNEFTEKQACVSVGKGTLAVYYTV